MHTTPSSASSPVHATAHHWQHSTSEVLCEVRGGVGFITLNRPQALNALSLGMVRSLFEVLRAWQANPAIAAIAIRGSSKHGAFGTFCAGGDIRFFHDEALRGNPLVEDFFTEEYMLNHLTHTLGKPYIAFMDGIVMGGGMGISQGADYRIVTEQSRLAMPETLIGLFPDVGGSYFLSRCAGHIGEWLALTGTHVLGADSISIGLADHLVPAAHLPALWQTLGEQAWDSPAAARQWLAQHMPRPASPPEPSADFAHACEQAQAFFGASSVAQLMQALDAAAASNPWAQACAATLRQRSPLMLHVAWEEIRRARGKPLADALRTERDLVRHCIHPRHLHRDAHSSEVIEGIRALAVDKDKQPRWNPASIDAVTSDMVNPFFISPWPAATHPLAGLRDTSAA